MERTFRSPFLDSELFVPEPDVRRARRADTLVAGSPFLDALTDEFVDEHVEPGDESYDRRQASDQETGPDEDGQELFEQPVPERARTAAQTACGLFLPVDSSDDYEKYIAAPTTGRMTPFVNGRYWGGVKPKEDQFEAFNAMQAAVEALRPGDSLFLAAWMFDPSVPLTKTNAKGVNALGNANWGELFQRQARCGVKIRILMTDFSSIFQDQYDKLYNSFLPTLDRLIAGLPKASRDNLKYVVSLHPATHLKVHVATHHQKFMVLKTGKATTAFCGGLDLAFMRTPAYWGKLDATTYRWLWHDIHCGLEGLITKDLEREFVMRWNREKDRSVVASRPGWKPLETLVRSAPTKADKAAARNAHPLQMLRTVSTQGAGRNIQNTRRDDIWQGYLRLIGCAKRFLYMENQYFREPRMADAIVTQAKAQRELLVIIVVPSETDDRPDPGKKHGDWRQHEFFVRLTKGIPASRLRVYTMFHRIIHAKLIMVDGKQAFIGSQNYTSTSMDLNREVGVIISGPSNLERLRRVFDRDFSMGIPVNPYAQPLMFATSSPAPLRQ